MLGSKLLRKHGVNGNRTVATVFDHDVVVIDDFVINVHVIVTWLIG